MNGKWVYMFETHPLLFTGKFVFWTNKGINFTIFTLQGQAEFSFRIFLWKTKIEIKV